MTGPFFSFVFSMITYIVGVSVTHATPYALFFFFSFRFSLLLSPQCACLLAPLYMKTSYGAARELYVLTTQRQLPRFA